MYRKILVFTIGYENQEEKWGMVEPLHKKIEKNEIMNT